MSRFNRKFLFFCILLASFLLSVPSASAQQSAAGASFKAVLILEHDGSSAWNELLRSGLEKAAGRHGIQSEVIVAPAGPEQKEIFKKAAAGANLVLVASDGLHEILRDNAANFRRVKFGAIDAGIRAGNIMSVTFADEQAAFLAGFAAATLAENGVIGWLAGQDTPAMRSLVNGYGEGAKLANPDVRVAQAVCGSFNNPEAARQKADWLVQNGAKIITVAAGAGSRAAKEYLKDKAVPFIALDSTDAGDSATIVKAVDRAVQEIVDSAVSSAFRAKEIVVYDLANGGVDFVAGDKLAAAAGRNKSRELDRRLVELRHELQNGGIRLNSLRARTLCDCLE